ncbi:hypothetical protein FBU30_006111 [Linnemannia zychae]|nr:hypothetical protein FBU30_006111 [Linnemannia zychae]
MKTVTLLLPTVLLSSVLAWGRDGANTKTNTYQENFSLPAESRRFDYKQSLKKPFTYNNEMPFWDNYGTPSVPGLKGAVWRQAPNEYKEWEVELQFKAFGHGQTGGKGLAFWYTQDRAVDGPVFGSKDQWKGLGIFMDTSDPANHRLNPVIYGIMNDGSKPFPSNPTANTNSFGGCLRDYKNSHTPVVVRVSYIGGILKVSADTHSKGKKMVPCFEQKDLNLPLGYYFGVTAQSADHGSPDDHDLYAFEMYEVNPPKKEKNPLRPHEAEMKKKGEEVKIDTADQLAFEEVQKIVEEQEAKLKEETDGPNTLSASQMAATVGDTQYRIIESLNSIHNKLETLGAPMQPPESSQKSLEDINHKINSMAASLHAMESVVQGLVDHIMKQGGIASGPDISKVLKEELRNLNAKMEDIDSRQSLQHRLTQTRLLNSTSWVTYVVFLILLQIIGVSVYTWYRKRLEMNEKKFL